MEGAPRADAAHSRVNLLSGAWLDDAPEARAEYETYSSVYDILFEEADSDVDFWRTFATGERSICEMGCGSGRLTSVMSQSAKVVGIDPVPQMLSLARRKLGPEVELREGDLRRIPAGDGEFGAVLCTRGAFSHLISPVDHLVASAELARVVDVKGTLVIDVPYYERGNSMSAGSRKPERVVTKSVGDRTYTFLVGSNVNHKWNYIDLEQVVEVRKNGRRRLEDRVSFTLRTKIFTPAELVFLLLASGFQVERVLGDYSGRPFDSMSERIIVVATKVVD